jgi:hypothetical protein
MSNAKRLVIPVAVLSAVLGFASMAHAQKKGGGGGSTGGSTNCKGDRTLDAPMQFTSTVQGSRVHLSALGGSDKTGWVVPSVWRIYNGSGTQVDYFPKGLLIFVSQNMLREANLEGLVPGTSYTIELTSVDFCNNAGTVRQSIVLPQPASETNAPALSTPTLASIGLQTGQFTQLQFSVTDDTGIREIAVYVAGTKIQEYKYYDGVGYRWWFDDYPADGTQSVLEGPNYYVNYPTSYQGQYVLVEVDATDALGNVTRQSAWMVLQ